MRVSGAKTISVVTSDIPISIQVCSTVPRLVRPVTIFSPLLESSISRLEISLFFPKFSQSCILLHFYCDCRIRVILTVFGSPLFRTRFNQATGYNVEVKSFDGILDSITDFQESHRPNLTATVDKLMAVNSDVILICAYPPQVKFMVDLMKSRNYLPKLIIVNSTCINRHLTLVVLFSEIFCALDRSSQR